MTNKITTAEKSKRFRFAYIVALSTWTFLAFQTFYQWFNIGELFAYYDEKHTASLIDFTVYYAAGLIGKLAMHVPTNIYDIQLQDQTLKQVIYPVAPPLPWFIQSPAPLFLICSILPVVSMPIAWLIWCILGDIALLISLYILFKRDCSSPQDFGYIVLGVVASFPFWYCNRMGQFATFLTASTILFWWAIRSKRNMAAGLTTAVILLKMQYLPFLGLVGLVQGRVKFVLTAILACTALMAISGMALGWANVLDYPKILLHGEYATTLYSGISPESQQNVRSILFRLTGADSALNNKICFGLCLSIACGVALLWVKGLKQIDINSRFKFLATLTICCMLVFSPHAHTQDYLVLCVPTAWIWLESLREGGAPSKWARKFAIALPMLSWLLFLLEKLQPPIPMFVLMTPILVAASWVSFCSPAAQLKLPNKTDILDIEPT